MIKQLQLAISYSVWAIEYKQAFTMFYVVNLMHHLPPNSNKLFAYEPLAREIGDEVTGNDRRRCGGCQTEQAKA